MPTSKQNSSPTIVYFQKQVNHEKEYGKFSIEVQKSEGVSGLIIYT